MDLNYTQVKDVLGFFGNKVASISGYTIKKVSEYGINVTPLATKVFSLLLILFLLYVFISLIEIPKKAIKFGLIICLVIIATSIIFSML